MKCPKCQAENKPNAKFCEQCGAPLPQQNGEAAKAAVTSTFAFSQEARKARVLEAVDPSQLLSARAYNMTILGVLLWGLLVNVLLCQFAGDAIYRMNPIVFIVGYFVLAFGGIFLANKSHHPALSFLGYNMVVVPFGLVISAAVSYYAEIDPSIVRDAFLYTLLISAGMMALALVRPQLFAKLGGILLGALIGILICEIVLLILRIDQQWTNWAVAGLFSLYIGYDVYRSQQYPMTLDNAVDSALDIYMDIANLFLRILQILGNSKRKS